MHTFMLKRDVKSLWRRQRNRRTVEPLEHYEAAMMLPFGSRSKERKGILRFLPYTARRRLSARKFWGSFCCVYKHNSTASLLLLCQRQAAFSLSFERSSPCDCFKELRIVC